MPRRPVAHGLTASVGWGVVAVRRPEEAAWSTSRDAVARSPARRVTIADIARDLGISKAAVSYALNGQPGVAADTRQRVLDRAAELGWHASSSARALSGAQTGVVGLALARPPDLLTIETLLHALPRRRREGPDRAPT